jgi:hypothetical protein
MDKTGHRSNMCGKVPKCERRKNKVEFINRTPDQGTDAVLNETERNAGFSCKRICFDFLGNRKSGNYQDAFRTCRIRTELWNGIRVGKSTFCDHTWIFFQKNSTKSVTNTVKNITKTLWLLKSSNKTSGPQICWQTIAGHWRWIYLTPNTGEIHKPLHFRG